MKKLFLFVAALSLFGVFFTDPTYAADDCDDIHALQAISSQMFSEDYENRDHKDPDYKEYHSRYLQDVENYNNASAKLTSNICDGYDFSGCMGSPESFRDCSGMPTPEKAVALKAAAAAAAIAGAKASVQQSNNLKNMPVPSTPTTTLKAPTYDARCVSKALTELKDAYVLVQADKKDPSAPGINDAAAKLCQGPKAGSLAPNACFDKVYPQMQKAYLNSDGKTPDKQKAASTAVNLCQGAIASDSASPDACFTNLFTDIQQKINSNQIAAPVPYVVQANLKMATDAAAQVCAGTSSANPDPKKCFDDKYSSSPGRTATEAINDASDQCEAVQNFCIGDKSYPDYADGSKDAPCSNDTNFFKAPLPYPGSPFVPNVFNPTASDSVGGAGKAK